MRAAILSLIAFAAPVMAADDDKAYYPLKVGTKWTYKIDGQDDRFIIVAIKEEKIAEQMCMKLEAKLKDQLVASEHLAVLKDGVYRFKFNDSAIEPPICFFKPSAKKGEKWTQAFKVADQNATGKYEMDVEDVEVPFGKYKDALVVRGDAIEKVADKDVVTKTTIWYAKNVGMVKQVITSGEMRIALILENMEAPKE